MKKYKVVDRNGSPAWVLADGFKVSVDGVVVFYDEGKALTNVFPNPVRVMLEKTEGEKQA